MDKGGSGPPPPKSSFAMYNGAQYPGPPHRAGYGQQVGTNNSKLLQQYHCTVLCDLC
jgi:hypothetical protein